eukprot:scaffold79412_cov66-Phaeocystis_antarctica.AAC.2
MPTKWKENSRRPSPSNATNHPQRSRIWAPQSSSEKRPSGEKTGWAASSCLVSSRVVGHGTSVRASRRTPVQGERSAVRSQVSMRSLSYTRWCGLMGSHSHVRTGSRMSSCEIGQISARASTASFSS